MAERTLIRVQGLQKSLSGFQLTIPDLEIAENDFFTVIGPSGAGKTTFLKLLGGFISPDSGSILLGGQEIDKQRGRSRVIRTFFQDYALFPHLTVENQLALGARLAGRSRASLASTVIQFAERLHLDGRLKSYPSQLSGGERQRLALGRAMIAQPRLLLLDEPLAALDPTLKLELWDWVEELRAGTATTLVIVTHDPDLALARSDRILVFSNGQSVQVGTPPEIYSRPNSEIVARLTGSANVFAWEGRSAVIRPERVELSLEPVQKVDFCDRARVAKRIYRGSITDYCLAWQSQLLLARRRSGEDAGFKDDAVYFGFRRDDLRFLT